MIYTGRFSRGEDNMNDEKWKLEYDLGGLKLKFQNYNVKKMVDVPKIIETIKKNAPKFVSYLIEERWTIRFRYLEAEGDEVENVFFHLDEDIKRININVGSAAPVDLLYHYLSYAIIYTYELYHDMKNSSYITFLSAMIMEFSDFVKVAKVTTEKIESAFAIFDVYPDDLGSSLLYEYATPSKYLYEAYALYIEKNEGLKQLELTSYIIEKIIFSRH